MTTEAALEVLDIGFALGRKSKGPKSKTGLSTLQGPYASDEFSPVASYCREQLRQTNPVRCSVDWIQIMVYGINLGPQIMKELERLRGLAEHGNEAVFKNSLGSWHVGPRGFGIAACHFAYRLEGCGLSVGISKRDRSPATGGGPILTVTATGTFCCGKAFWEIAESLRKVVKAFGVICERTSITRLDIATDVVGLRVSEVLQKLCNGQTVSRARRWSMEGGFSNGIETLEIGKRSGSVRLQVYDKALELLHNPLKAKVYCERWNCRLPEVMTRYEFRLNGDGLRERGIKSLEDVEKSLNSLFRYLTDDWWRELEKPVDRRHTERAALCPFYDYVRDSAAAVLVGDRPLSKPVKPIAEKHRLLAQASGCIAAACAFLGFIPADASVGAAFVSRELSAYSEKFQKKVEVSLSRLRAQFSDALLNENLHKQEKQIIFPPEVNSELATVRNS